MSKTISGVNISAPGDKQVPHLKEEEELRFSEAFTSDLLSLLLLHVYVLRNNNQARLPFPCATIEPFELEITPCMTTVLRSWGVNDGNAFSGTLRPHSLKLGRVIPALKQACSFLRLNLDHLVYKASYTNNFTHIYIEREPTQQS